MKKSNTSKSSFFRPEKGDTYYSVEMEGAAYYYKHSYGDVSSEDALRLRIGNVFKTRDEAKTMCVKINKLFKQNKK